MNDPYLSTQESNRCYWSEKQYLTYRERKQTYISTWAIRQKSTGYFLPHRKNGRGFSFDEPTKDCFPRLFKSELSASRALSAWLRGTWDRPVYDHDEWGHSDYKVAAEPTKVDSRDPHDMEIVQFTLYEVVQK